MMKQYILTTLLLLCFKINAQVQQIPFILSSNGCETSKMMYRESLNMFLNLTHYSMFSDTYTSFNYNDFDLIIGKKVKNISFDTYDDQNQEYYYEFDKDGKITFIDDFLRKCTHKYNYLNNLITVVRYSKNLKKDTDIDSIYFDDKKNVIKHSFTTYLDKECKNYTWRVEENQYSENNTLTQKHFYSYSTAGLVYGYLCIFENFSDSIVEKKYELNTLVKMHENFWNKNIYNSKYIRSIYHLNKNNDVFKITESNDNGSSKILATINYDKEDRIYEFINHQDSSSRYFKYDTSGNISQIKNFNGIYKFKHDINNRLISISIQKGDTTEKWNDYSFIYDQYGNWIKKLVKTYTENPILESRKITYY